MHAESLKWTSNSRSIHLHTECLHTANLLKPEPSDHLKLFCEHVVWRLFSGTAAKAFERSMGLQRGVLNWPCTHTGTISRRGACEWIKCNLSELDACVFLRGCSRFFLCYRLRGIMARSFYKLPDNLALFQKCNLQRRP